MTTPTTDMPIEQIAPLDGSGKPKRPRLRLSKQQREFQQRTLLDLGLSDEFRPSPYLVRVLAEALVDARAQRGPSLGELMRKAVLKLRRR